MTAPGLVRRSRNATKRRSRLPFHWRASDVVELGLDALSGQEATFTRASAGGLIVDRNGRLVGPHANALPRYQMHDLDGDGVRETPALLLEGQRTNLVDDQDLTTWTTSATPGRSQDDAGPDKKDSGYNVSDNDNGADEHILKTISFTGNAVKAVAVWVKEGTSGEARVSLRDTTAGANLLNMLVTSFDSTTGEPTVTEGVGTLLGKVRGPDKWWRLVCQTTSVTAANTNQLRLHPGVSNPTTGGALFALPQAEDAAVPSSDITTSGSTVTRSAELLQYDIGWTPADIERNGGLTGLFEWKELGAAFAGAAARYWHIGGPGEGSDPRMALDSTGPDGRVRLFFDDSTSVASAETAAGAIDMLDHAWARCVVFLDGSTWKLQLHISTDGETETSTPTSTISGGVTAGGDTWSDGLLTLNASPAATFPGLTGHLSHKFAFGNRTLAQMRAAF